MIKLKVCGMREHTNILEVASCMPDYMGFIFYEKSPRFVGKDFEIPATLSDSIKRVGVFVDEQYPVIKQLVTKLSFDYVQLHGHETTELCMQLKSDGVGVIKVFSVDDAFDFAVTSSYKPYADFFLFDTKGKYHGGNAVTFDWSVLTNYDQEVPFFLSGGINPDNVKGADLLRGMNLHALDVNSGVEVSPALKDLHRVQAINDYLKTF